MAECRLYDLLIQEDRRCLGGRHAKQLERLSIHCLHILPKCLRRNTCVGCTALIHLPLAGPTRQGSRSLSMEEDSGARADAVQEMPGHTLQEGLATLLSVSMACMGR